MPDWLGTSEVCRLVNKTDLYKKRLSTSPLCECVFYFVLWVYVNVNTLCVFVCLYGCVWKCVCLRICVCFYVSLTLWLYQFWHFRPDLVTEVKPMYSVPRLFWIQSTFVLDTVGTVGLRTAKI